MSDLNVITMTGRLTRDVKLSYTPNQTAIAEVGLACGRKYGDKDETCFVELKVFGKMAETLNTHLKKGSRIGISGRLEYNEYDGKDGQKVRFHRVIVNDFTFLDSKPDSSNGSGSRGNTKLPFNQSDIPF